MKRALQVIGLAVLLAVALTSALLARARGRQARFERARIDRVEDATTPLQRDLFAQGCSSVRVVPINESMSSGPAGALWVECWNQQGCDLIDQLPVSTWPSDSWVTLHGANEACEYSLWLGRAEMVGGSRFYSPHAFDRRSRSRRLKDFIKALFR